MSNDQVYGAAGFQRAPAGWYPDPQGPGQRYWDGGSWALSAGPAVLVADPYAEHRADEMARGIANYERASGVVWIVLGIIQIFTIYLAIAGIWNVFAGITRLAAAPAILRREARVPAMFAGVVGLIVIGLVNLFFGAIFGLIMVAVDFYIRQRVLDNRQIFNR